MARPLPIRIRWTLLFASVMAAILAAALGYIYSKVERRFSDEAALMLASLMTEVREEITRNPTDPGRVVEEFVGHVARFDRKLRVGVAILGPDGTPRASAGTLAGHPLPLPQGPRRAGDAISLLDLGEPYPYLAQVSQDALGFLQVVIYAQRYERAAKQFRHLIEGMIPLSILLTGVVGWWLSGQTLQPIVAITAAARRISAEHLSERIRLRGTRDELDQLACTLNDMLARIEEGVQRLRSFSVHAAHQLRSPILRLRSRLDVALDGNDFPEAERDLLGDVLREVEDLGCLVDGMMRLSRSEAGLDPERVSAVSLLEVVESTVEFFEPIAETKQIAVTFAPRGDAVVAGDATWLRELFANLLDNAIRYTAGGGSIVVRIESRLDDAMVEISDTGAGMSADEAQRAFDRFFRGRATVNTPGSGLGLALAREIARAHSGEIELETALGRGSTFRVRLPSRRGSLGSSPACAVGHHHAF